MAKFWNSILPYRYDCIFIYRQHLNKHTAFAFPIRCPNIQTTKRQNLMTVKSPLENGPNHISKVRTWKWQKKPKDTSKQGLQQKCTMPAVTDPAMMAEFKDADGDIRVNIGGRQQFHAERSMLLGVAVLLRPVQSTRLKHITAAVWSLPPQWKPHLKYHTTYCYQSQDISLHKTIELPWFS